MVRKLNDKQEIAADNYCLKAITNKDEGYSWSQAMRDAGYKQGYIDKNAHLLRDNPLIDERIKETKQRLLKAVEMSAEDVIRELAIIGRSNVSDYIDVNEDGDVCIRGFKGISREKLAAVESIKVNTTKNKDNSREYTTTQFKLHSKLSALDALCKHLGVYAADNAQRTEQIQLDTVQTEEAQRIARIINLEQARSQATG